MAGKLFTLPKQFLLSNSGALIPGAKAYFYINGTSTLQAVYTTRDLAVAHANPVIADGNGRWPAIYLDESLLYKVKVTDAAGVEIYSEDDFTGTTSWGWPQTALELAAGVTPTDTLKEPGNVLRYGAVADSDSLTITQGTDNTGAFNDAISTGHPVYVPEGDYSIEGTINIVSTSNVDGGVTFVMNSKVRLERYSSAIVPIMHIYGSQNYVDGQGGQLAARSGGGFTKGFVLIGQDPAATDNTHVTMEPTNFNAFRNFKIIGKTSNTGWDGSVGVRFESAARRRGQYTTPVSITCYYNHIENVLSTQWDYCFFLSTDCNANTFDGCNATSYGHAAWHINGALNQFNGVTAELTPAQDTTERYAWHFGLNNSGPEATFEKTNEDATSVALSAITKGSPTTIDCAAVHSLSTGNTVLLEGIVDNGPDGDLEGVLNDGVFKVTVTDTDSFTIPIDTSALTNIYSSGGTLKNSHYPALTGKANQVNGYTETVYNASTANVRALGWTTPNGAYDLPRQFVETYGLNVLNISGSLTGGVGPGGSSASSVIGNNIVRNNSVHKHPLIKTDFNSFWFRKLDDQSDSTFGTDEFKIISGRMADIAASTTFDLFTIDNVGGSGATITGGLIIKLSFCGKEQTGNDLEGGEISWLCPVNNNTANAAIKYKDFQANENTSAFTFGVTNAAGTTTNTGKYVLQVTTSGAAGDFYLSWKVELVSSELEGVNLDWDYDVTVQNGGQ